METALYPLVGVADAVDAWGTLGGGRDHILAALVVGWVLYALVGRRIRDPGFRFFALCAAVAAGLAVPSPIELILIATALYAAVVVLEWARVHRAIALVARGHPAALRTA